MVLELRPSHDPEATWGFVGVVVSTEDLSGVDLALAPRRRRVDGRQGHHDPGRAGRPGPAAARAASPSARCRRWSPTSTCSVDDRLLYVSCWGTGELKQYDVSDPAHPREVGSVRLGGIVGAHRRTRRRPSEPLAGGPQMVEVSRDGRRVYVTNSLYGAWDDQFYPDGVGAWMAKIDTDPGAAG